MYKLDQQASTLAVEYNNRKAFRTMSRAVYEKSVNFVSANLSRVKDNQESFISREPLGIPHRGPSKRPRDFQRFSKAGLSLRARGRGFSPATGSRSPCYFHRKQTWKENQKNFLAVHYPYY